MGDWHILTVSEGGTVSILKNLTEDAAREVMQRLANFHEYPDWKPPEGNNYSWTVFPDAGRIARKECWGPEGQKLDIWKGWKRK